MNPFVHCYSKSRSLYKVVLSFESVDKILWCYHSNESSLAVLSRGTIYLVCSSNFRVSGRNPMVLPFIVLSIMHLVCSSTF